MSIYAFTTYCLWCFEINWTRCPDGALTLLLPRANRSILKANAIDLFGTFCCRCFSYLVQFLMRVILAFQTVFLVHIDDKNYCNTWILCAAFAVFSIIISNTYISPYFPSSLNQRLKINAEEISTAEVMRWYNTINAALLDHLTNQIKETDNSGVWR